MARIRTIKPEFFTSEDIVALSPMARLLYIALWCESDKEGRMLWKPKTFKMRYFPADGCDIDALCSELIGGGLVHLYGDGLAFIPSFTTHQHINPRESVSQLPEPDKKLTRRHASPRVNSKSDAQGGREGKGRESKGDATRDAFGEFWEAWPSSTRKVAKDQCVAKWRAKGLDEIADQVIAALESFKACDDWSKESGRFIPAPLVWLNQSRWEAAEAKPATSEAGFI